MGTKNLGRIAYIDQGVYNPEASYTKHDVVHYDNGMYAYVHAVDSAGNPPSDTAFWVAMLEPAGINAAAERISATATSMENAVNLILLDEIALSKHDNHVVNIPLATYTNNGMMSAEDKALLDALDGTIHIDTWNDIKAVVQKGAGKKFFPVGTQLYSEKLRNATVSVSGNITAATINMDVFTEKLGGVSSGIYAFMYTSNDWHYHDEPVMLSEYGIAVTGEVHENDMVFVNEMTDVYTWDIVHHGLVSVAGEDEPKPGMVLLMHHAIWGMYFDAQEALYYVSGEVWPEGMPAGTYNFVTGENSMSWDGAGTYAFTTTHTIPVGGHIELSWLLGRPVINGNVKTYSSGSSTTAIETLAPFIGQINDGISIGSTAYTHLPKYNMHITENMNCIDRAYSGSNNYAECAIRQWINSDATTWWQPQTIFDRPPVYKDRPGFLRGMDARFLAAVGTTNVQCETNHLFEVDPDQEIPYIYHVQDKFFLPSTNETGRTYELQLDCTPPWDAYKDATTASYIKYDMSANSMPRAWLLRSGANTNIIDAVRSNGEKAASLPSYESGLVVACVIC